MAFDTSENQGTPQPHEPMAPAEAHALALEDRARMFLESLGHTDHPLAAEDPIYALYQVAVDYRCMAQGYEGLLKRKEGKED